MLLNPGCPSCGALLVEKGLQRSDEHVHAVLARCAHCGVEVLVSVYVTEYRAVYARNLDAPGAALVDLIDRASNELGGARARRLEGARLA